MEHERTCFFIGHREANERVLPALEQAVEQLIVESGVTDFVVGHYGAFDGMAVKTMLRNLLGKYGILSVEMIGAMSADGDELAGDTMAREAIEQNANQGEVIDIEVKDAPATDQQEPPF